ncbi:PQQ-binding-like beta-propeller repeat protein [bacterium]|nr:MAG: PQQ-binding-like beta-propeller repeat protein [bacterium]
MKRFIVIAALAWCVAYARPVFAGDDVAKATPAWKVKTKNKLENVQEVLGGQAFFSREDDYVSVINAADGKVLWEKELKGFKSKKSLILVKDDQLSYTTKKEFVILNMNDGSEKSRTPFKKDPRSGKEVSESDFVESVRTPNGYINIFQKSVTFTDFKGNEMWTRGDENMGAGNYKLFDNGNFLAFYSKSVSMIDYTNGNDLWSRNDQGFMPDYYHQIKSGHFVVFYEKSVRLVAFDSGKDLYASAEPSNGDLKYTWYKTAADNDAIIVFLKKSTVLVDGKNGKLLWSAAIKGSEERGGVKKDEVCAESVGNAAVIYLEKQAVGVHCISGKQTWKEDVKDDDEIADAASYTYSENDQIVAGLVSVNKVLIRYDVATAEKIWRTPDNSFIGQMVDQYKIEGDDFLFVSGRRAFLMTNKELGVHLYRVNIKDGTIKWHTQTRAGWSNAFGKNVKTTYANVASGPFIFKDKNLIALVTNMGLALINLTDGTVCGKDGKWTASKIGDWKTPGCVYESYKMIYASTIVPPTAQTVNIVAVYASAFSSMRNMSFVNLNPDPIIVGDVMYVCASMDEKVVAVDIKGGKKLWECDVNGPIVKLPFSKGLAVKDGNVFVRTGFYLDENILFGVNNPKPTPIGDKGDFGFVGIDGKTGKVMWKFQDFDKMDPVYLVDVVTDKAYAEKAQNGNCSQKKLKLGLVGINIDRPSYMLIGGGNGIAGIQRDANDPCKALWHIDDDFTAASAAYELGAGTTAMMLFANDVKRTVICSNKNMYLVDEAAHKVLWKAKKESNQFLPALVSTKAGLLLDVDGKEMTAYKFVN